LITEVWRGQNGLIDGKTKKRESEKGRRGCEAVRMALESREMAVKMAVKMALEGAPKQ
jgi:hypothetical protein